MCAIDPKAPTEEENEITAISKYRYMRFRESLTSTIDFGFRIEGMKVSNVSGYNSLAFDDTDQNIISLLIRSY